MFLPDAAPPCNVVGEQLRDGGTIRAARKRPVETLTLQLAALEAALTGESFTVDDLTPADQLAKPFVNRGPHRGAAMLGLAKRSLITQTGERRRSERAHRHAGTNPVWRAAAHRLGTTEQQAYTLYLCRVPVSEEDVRRVAGACGLSVCVVRGLCGW